jgi:hypothetical protein
MGETSGNNNNNMHRVGKLKMRQGRPRAAAGEEAGVGGDVNDDKNTLTKSALLHVLAGPDPDCYFLSAGNAGAHAFADIHKIMRAVPWHSLAPCLCSNLLCSNLLCSNLGGHLR